MEQPTFADLEYQGKKRKIRREMFLERLDGLVLWHRLEERIRPFYPKAGKGRRPYSLAVMLRVHCVQLCYNLSAPSMEGLLYEAESVRRFVGLKLSEALPDETTILNFRHLLEKHSLGAGSAGGNQRAPGVAETAAQGGDHCRRQHHRGAVVHQEPRWGAGPGDAPDQEGE